MHLNAQKPVFVPSEYRAEIEKLSKAALMDLAWDFAFQQAGESPSEAMVALRTRIEIILTHRKQARTALLGRERPGT